MEDPVATHLRALCARVGFDLDHAAPSIMERMRLLAAYTETVADAERMAEQAFDVFAHYEREKPASAFSATEQRTIVLGCLFSDIGKTGPAHADEAGQRLIVEMFSVEGVRDDTQPVARFLSTYFPSDADARIARFIALGLDPAMPIRHFWNLHSGWTLTLIERSGVPSEVVAAAATHHMLEDVNPESIVGEDHHYTRAFGENLAFDRSEKLVIVLDKYDALRRRARRTHAETIAWLRERVEKSARFRGDRELEALIEDVDVVLRPHDA